MEIALITVLGSLVGVALVVMVTLLRSSIGDVRADVASVRSEVAGLRSDLRADMAQVRTDMAQVRTEMAAVERDLRMEIRASEERVTSQVGATIDAAVERLRADLRGGMAGAA